MPPYMLISPARHCATAAYQARRRRRRRAYHFVAFRYARCHDAAMTGFRHSFDIFHDARETQIFFQAPAASHYLPEAKTATTLLIIYRPRQWHGAKGSAYRRLHYLFRGRYSRPLRRAQPFLLLARANCLSPA